MANETDMPKRRNAAAVVAKSRNGGFMRDKRERRANEKKRDYAYMSEWDWKAFNNT